MGIKVTTWRRKLHRFRALSREERAWFLQAFLVMNALTLGLRFWDFQRCYDFLKRRPWRARRQPAPQMRADFARRFTAIANRAAGNGLVNITCLPHSLALWWLLRRYGVEAKLFLGVGKDAPEFIAHAWIEYQGEVLNDSPDVRQRYAVFDRALI